MTKIAKKLEAKGWLLRSGGASGADMAFENGITDPINKRIYLPWRGFGNGPPAGCGRVIASELPGWRLAQKTVVNFHPNPERLSRGGVALMARNAMQILGDDIGSPADLVIAWTPGGRLEGGTAQALRLAANAAIPIKNLGVNAVAEAALKWVEE